MISFSLFPIMKIPNSILIKSNKSRVKRVVTLATRTRHPREGGQLS